MFLKRKFFFTELSDFHKLVLSVFKTAFLKSKPKEITYSNIQNFSKENFNQEFRTNLGERCVKHFLNLVKRFS